MATSIESNQPAVWSQQFQHFLLDQVTWETYEALYHALCDRPALRMNYDGETLELMTVSPIHDYVKRMLGRLVEALTFELNIPIRCGGSMTFRRPDVARGLEPDDCFWISSEHLVRGKREFDFTVDPPPDLAIEVEITRSLVDRIAIYAKLQVPELWRFDGQSLRAFRLADQGEYKPNDCSLAFPFLPLQELVAYLRPDEQTDDTTRLRSFVQWLCEQGFADQLSSGNSRN